MEHPTGLQMKSIFKSVIAIAILELAGRAGGIQVSSKQPPAKAAGVAPAQPQQLIIFIPMTDQAASSWLKLFDRYPQLRMVIAVSPQFHRFVKDPILRDKFLALEQARRLEFALQIPNAPFLPLIINTDLAKSAVPPGMPLPQPSFAYRDDVIQVV